jgi:ppGpp synthetase/RelA/SpoT-type nucleotidyltranferase
MKLDIDYIIKEYDKRVAGYKDLAELVQYVISTNIMKIKIHSLSHRIKDLNSLIDKARRKKIENPFSDIHDIVGFRIVCLFLSDLEKIGEIIRGKFDVFEEDDKINQSELNIFGYMSLHFKAKLRDNDVRTSDSVISNLPFEIQVRTIAQDAWAAISHYLDYKKKSDIPNN